APGGVFVVDAVTLAPVTTFIIPRAACGAPQGAALGPDNQLLLGCNAPSLPPDTSNPTAIIDITTGALIAAIPNESCADEVWYNPGEAHYFLARSSAVGSVQLLGVIDARGPQADSSVVTAPKTQTGGPTIANSHSVAADPIRNQVYVAIGGAASNPSCG